MMVTPFLARSDLVARDNAAGNRAIKEVPALRERLLWNVTRGKQSPKS